MKMSGTRQLAAPQSVVWEKLNDVEVLKRCIPGCQSLEEVAENELKATVGLKIGPINAKFNGEVTLSDLDPPNSYRISGSGKGGPAGAASGGADVKLEPKDGGTLLSYDVDAKVSGKIAQLGSRLIDSTAASLANKFFENFAQEVEGPSTETGPEAAPQASKAAKVPGSLDASRLGLIAAAVAAALVIAYILQGS